MLSGGCLFELLPHGRGTGGTVKYNTGSVGLDSYLHNACLVPDR